MKCKKPMSAIKGRKVAQQLFHKSKRKKENTLLGNQHSTRPINSYFHVQPRQNSESAALLPSVAEALCVSTSPEARDTDVANVSARECRIVQRGRKSIRKRRVNAYILWRQGVNLFREHPSESLVHLNKKLGLLWHHLDEATRQSFVDEANRLRADQTCSANVASTASTTSTGHESPRLVDQCNDPLLDAPGSNEEQPLRSASDSASKKTSASALPKRQKVSAHRRADSAQVELNKGDLCMLCHTSEQSADLGLLQRGHGLTAHYRCMLFSSALPQASDLEEHVKEHLAGFEPASIRAELRRGSKLRCSHCRRGGATMGCNTARCPKKYHLPCAYLAGAVLLHHDTFPMFCSHHRPRQHDLQIRWQSTCQQSSSSYICCAVCLDNLMEEQVQDGHVLHGTCCSSSWLHLNCAKQLGISAGRYHIRCPLCGDMEQFASVLLSLGVELPVRDAAWEAEQAFEELYIRPTVCAAQLHTPEGCPCPKGAAHDANRVNAAWDQLVCHTCGAHAAHNACAPRVGKLLNSERRMPWRFECFECVQIQESILRSAESTS